MRTVPRRRARSRGRALGRVRMLLGVVLLIAGGVIVFGSFKAPETVDRAYGEAKTVIQDHTNQVREEVLGELPTVKLGATGGMKQLDRCDGTFTEMRSYEHDKVPPVWAAHNNCSGDVILPWELGQRIRLDGSDRVYVVVDVRNTGKTWATIDDLVGLGGEFALQTCYYGEDRMKFIGISPA